MTHRRLRVLVVDDAIVVRRLVCDVLAADPELEVCGHASNGRIALAKLEELAPDLVTLDIEMPELDGLATLTELRKTHPVLPVIMFSTLTEHGARAALDALARGASDYVTKPTNTGSIQIAKECVQKELIPRIKWLCRGVLGTSATATHPAAPRALPPLDATGTHVPRPILPARPRAANGTRTVSVVAIGCSTGGPNALESVLTALPADLAVPVVLVQHMPPMFTRLLAERLDQKCAVSVVEAAPGMPLEPGTVYVAPGNWHLVLERKGLAVLTATNQDAPENSCRPAVDVLFRSVARAYGGEVVAAVLTGMGQDGLRGCRALAEQGAQILAQDEATSVVWGMPGYVAQSGLADRVLPVTEIGAEIARRVREGRRREEARRGG
ncbi:MAG: chemotaxis response regulator protein-glutamate methylesterase [Planctomycetes bacterium]|nr:chemotaxis response regulator protein-glutamate methylesterase [Planctomycetota bacterium]